MKSLEKNAKKGLHLKEISHSTTSQSEVHWSILYILPSLTLSLVLKTVLCTKLVSLTNFNSHNFSKSIVFKLSIFQLRGQIKSSSVKYLSNSVLWGKYIFIFIFKLKELRNILNFWSFPYYLHSLMNLKDYVPHEISKVKSGFDNF